MLTEIKQNQNFKVEFSTKAETLSLLKNKIKTAHILPYYFFTVEAWHTQKENILKELSNASWGKQKIIVRSSALIEDSIESSHAGQFTSVLNIQGEQAIIDAIETVISSYHPSHPQNQVLLQPQLTDVVVSGVAFGRDPNTGGPYIVINYDDSSGSTTSITSGTSSFNRCFVWHKYSTELPDGFLHQIIFLLKELEALYQTDWLDMEFGITSSQKLYLFQARPLLIKQKQDMDDISHSLIMQRIAHKVGLGCDPHPYLFGKRTVYGIMPDWNPAEIIGVRPRPLALSLYRELITNSIWAYQRDNYGYNNLRSFPLLVDFEGLPYIDVRVSFNSFLPKGLTPELSEKLLNYYINALIKKPELHDKVEFDIIFSCYTLDLEKRLNTLQDHGFSAEECMALLKALTSLTNRIIHNQDGLWKQDLEKIYELQRKQILIKESSLDPLSKMYWLLEDCKRYGTLPFAGLARAGFIAVQILKSFISEGIITDHEYTTFFSSLNTVSSQIANDFSKKNPEEFLSQYGHLRPGTYDILSSRYDEAPDDYFDWSQSKEAQINKVGNFSLSIEQLRAIQEKIDSDGLKLNVLELLEFIKIAIESREFSKFIFTRSVSDFLAIFSGYAASYGFSKDDCSFVDVKVIESLYSSSHNPQEIISHFMALGKKQFSITQSITLPPLLCDERDVYSFHVPENIPNFITQRSCLGPVVTIDSPKNLLQNAILMIPSADPGYDWVFSYPIAGLITQFGGVNSHMAIRAGELEIPAVIGAGEIRYKQWSNAKKLSINAANKQVHIL